MRTHGHILTGIGAGLVVLATATQGAPPRDAARVLFGARPPGTAVAERDVKGAQKDGPALRLAHGTISTADGTAQGRAEAAAALAASAQRMTPRGTLPVLVQFDGPAPASAHTALAAAGCSVAGYLPPNGYLLEAPVSRFSALTAIPGLRWLGEYKPAYKISAGLSEARAAYYARAERAAGTNDLRAAAAPVPLRTLPPPIVDAYARVTLHLFCAGDMDDVMAELVALGSKEMGGVAGGNAPVRWGRIRARVPFAALDALAQLAAVQWIEEYHEPELFNNVAVQPHLMNVTPVWETNWLGLTGRGQVVAHADTGLDTGSLGTLHPDFTNRLRAAFSWARPGEWSDPNGHGTHTAGALAGNGSALSNGLLKGVAFEAQLVHQSLYYDAFLPLGGLPTNLNLLFQQAYNTNARIHSISWGSAAAGAYNSAARDVDEFVWNHPDMLIVVAAGNGSDDSAGNGVVSRGTLASPASAKNALSVGAAESDRPAGSGGYSSFVYGSGAWEPRFPVNPIHDDLVSTSADGVHQGMYGFSSRGPAADGRIKPDIVAPGTDIISCRSRVGGASTFWGVYNENYMFSGGTSQATPLTAGAAALVRQYFMEKHAVIISNPSAALIKATLANGARSLAPGQYGYEQFREIPAPPRPNAVEGWGHVNLAASLTNVMVWDGHTLTSGATALYVVALADTNALAVTLAWSDYPGTLGAAQALVNDLDLRVMTPDGAVWYPNGLAGPDRTNNLEGIDLAMAPPGVCTVMVSGVVNMGGAQPYALVVRGAAPIVARLGIESVAIEPATVRPARAPVIAAVVQTNASGLAAVMLQYQANHGGWVAQPMAVRTPIETGGVYTNAIPPQAQDTMVELYVIATAHDGTAATNGPLGYKVSEYAVFVWGGGAQVEPYDTWATGFSNVYQAVGSPFVREGYTIFVTNGTYSARDSGVDDGIIINKGVRIIGVNGARVTLIDGGYAGRCITMINPDAVIEGFTITRGFAYYDAGIYGGGLYLLNGSVRNCVIEQCYAQGLDANGAGAALMGGGMLDGCVVRDNQAQGGWDAGGGGAWLQEGAVVRSTLFINNVAHSGGNNASGGNIALEYGGAVSNCTVVAGSANGVRGGGISIYRTGMVHNSIVYFNNNSNFWMSNAGSSTDPDFRWSHTCTTPLPGGTGVSGAGCFTNDPLLLNYAGYDCHLAPESPCRNAGETLPWMHAATDADAHARVAEGVVDMGAHEFGPLSVSFDGTPRTGLTPLRTRFTTYATGLDTNGICYYWDFNADGSNDLEGTVWDRPTNVYAEGLYSVVLAASNGAGELVHWQRQNFVYAFNTNVHYVAHGGGHVWPFTSFANAATNAQDAVNACISGHTVVISDGVYRVNTYVEVPNGITLRGWNGRDKTVIDGMRATPCLMMYAGGVADGLTLSNGASSYGGGVYFSRGGTLRNARIVNNQAGALGGGVYFYNGGTLEDALVMNNGEPTYGGGVAFAGNGTLQRCIIMNNRAYNGGGIYVQNPTAIIRNCVIAANTSDSMGGGVQLNAAATMENCTVADNTATSISIGRGGGVGVHNANVAVRNCIVYNNRAAGVQNNIFTQYTTAVTFQRTCTTPPFGAEWLTNDPRVANSAVRDYRLRGDSYCINNATNLSWMSGAKDAAGAARVINGAPDIGAYELATNAPLLRVTALDDPHQLGSMNFGDVWITDTIVKTLAVRNVGGSILSGAVADVAAPFACLSPAHYVLGSNSNEPLALAFAPESGMYYTTTAVFSGGGGAGVVLRGTGIPEPALLAALACAPWAWRRRTRSC